jgi:hypothetical protein
MVLRLPSWRVVAFLLVAIAWVTWAERHFTFRFLATGPNTEAQRSKVALRQAPLIAALRRYRDDNGTYPIRLDRLVPRYLPAVPSPHAYLYRGSEPLVVDSAECAKRADQLHGLAMTKTSELEERRAQYEEACVIGWRQFSLQSPDFEAPTRGPLERWAEYQSQRGGWVTGWCEHSATKHPVSTTGEDGICRW